MVDYLEILSSLFAKNLNFFANKEKRQCISWLEDYSRKLSNLRIATCKITADWKPVFTGFIKRLKKLGNLSI